MLSQYSRSFSFFRAAPELALAGLLWVAPPGHAAAEQVRSLTLAEALALAEQQNPTLQAQGQTIESNRANEITAGLRPNPTFQNDTTSATVGVYQEIETGGKRRNRQDGARLATSISRTDFLDARRALLLGVRQAFVNGLLARDDVSIAEENLSNFQKVIDLGEWWKRETGLPLPLGGNVLRKDIPHAMQHDLLEIIRESIDYGLAHRDEAVRHSLPYARDMNADLAGKFIGMYVNEFTRDYGETGRAAIHKFLGEAQRGGYIDTSVEVEFVE